MRRKGVDTFLIGETFMRASDPGAALADMFADSWLRGLFRRQIRLRFKSSR